MGANKTQITNYLEMRFDYQSARNVLVNWRKSAKIKEDLDSFDDNQLRSLLDYLKENAADATRVHAAIERCILSQDAPVSQEPACEEHREACEEHGEVEEVPAESAEPENQEIHAESWEASAENAEVPVEENVEAPVENAEVPAGENAEVPAENNGGKKQKKKH